MGTRRGGTISKGSLMGLSINTATPFLLHFAVCCPPFILTQGQHSSSPKYLWYRRPDLRPGGPATSRSAPAHLPVRRAHSAHFQPRRHASAMSICLVVPPLMHDSTIPPCACARAPIHAGVRGATADVPSPALAHAKVSVGLFCSQSRIYRSERMTDRRRRSCQRAGLFGLPLF
jgi:hypothetical protein